MTDVDKLLQRLDKVRRTRENRWMACCPAHLDNSPSLSIRLLDDGKILIHCFAQCGAADILEAVGLQMTDLMPEKGDDGYSNPDYYPRQNRYAREQPGRDRALLLANSIAREQGITLAKSEIEAEHQAWKRLHARGEI